MNTVLLQQDGDSIVLLHVDSPDNPITMSPAVAREYGGAEEYIPMTAEIVTEGQAVGDWLGVGTVISRTFEDTKRTITQTITLEFFRAIIENSIEYKQAVEIDYEGFRFSGYAPLDRFSARSHGVGSGQNIIGTTGMWFHHGGFTPHVVIADINTHFMAKQYAQNDTEFTKLYFTDGDKYAPVQILLQPDGYNASLTFSNHADIASMDRQAAVHYGVSDPLHADYGTKGLTSRGIVTDWSVWAKHTDTDRPGFVGNASYLAFLQGLKTAGHEIIPHTLSTGYDDRADAALYLPEFLSEFAPSNWTDHGQASGATTCALTSKGWDVDDVENYILDLFEANGFNKAWAYQDALRDKTVAYWGFPHGIAYYNDHIKLPVSGAHILLWKASPAPFGGGWLKLEKLIEACGSIDAHDYFAASAREAVADTTGFTLSHYYDDGDAAYKITTGFDTILAAIETAKAAGEVWNPTGTAYLEYFKQLKNVQVDLTDAGTLTITNANAAVVAGFSILIGKKSITPLLGGVAMDKKEVTHGTICWADLPVGESTVTY